MPINKFESQGRMAKVAPTDITPAAPARDGVLECDDSQAMADYANYCRVGGTPEEVIMDFGLSLPSMGVQGPPIVISRRVVLGWETAKRMVQVLHLCIERNESAFGVLETDVNRRVLNPEASQRN